MTGIKLIAGGGLAAFAGNFTAWMGHTGPAFAQIDFAAVISAISVGVLSLAGVFATAYGIYTQARIKAKKDFDEANRGSLSEQLAEMTANQEKMRRSLHEIREQANSERVKHAEEVARLIRQIELLQETVNHQSEEIERLNNRIAALTRGVERVERSTGTGSGDNIPSPA